MAINNIKIKAHDIFIEKDNDKGGNLTVGATNATTNLTVHGSTITDSLTVNAINVTGTNKTLTLSVDANSKLNISGAVNVEGAITSTTNISMSEIHATGDLTVGTDDKSANVNVYGDIVLYGNTNGTRTISCNKGLNVNAPGVALSSTGDLFLRAGSTNTTTINSPTMNIESTTVTISGTTNMNALNVTGDINNTGNLIVSANTTTNSLSVNAGISANGASIGTGGLTVGTNTNSANVNVFGNISINDNIVLRQNDSKTEIIVGSNDKPLKLFGSGDRPSYSKNGEGNINIALANDICNPTIKIKQDGTEKGSFTLNQSGDETIELTDTTYTPGTGLGLSTDNEFYVKTNYATKGTNYQVTTDDSGNLYVAVPWTNVATTSANGLMSSTDKSKLDGIETGATNITVDSSLSSTSTNPVQNNVIKSALDRKANLGHDHDGRYLKIEDTGAVILSSGPLKINYDDPGDYAPSDNAKYRPFPGINSSDLDMFIFDTGISCFDNDSGEGYQYSFPAKTGIFAMTSDVPILKVATGITSYSLAYGKTYKIKMNSDSYAYCSNISEAKFYGTFEISNFTIEYTPGASGPSGTQLTLPEYQYILCSSGARYAAQSSNTIQGFSTKYSKVSITLTANKGTFDVYELN